MMGYVSEGSRPGSARVVVLGKFAALMLTALGLGTLMGSGATPAVRVGGVVIALSLVVCVLAFSLDRLAISVVSALGLLFLDLLTGSGLSSVSYAALLFGFVFLGTTLTSELAALARQASPTVLIPVGPGGRPLDALASSELNRARRHARPLAVLSISVAQERRARDDFSSGQLVHVLGEQLRQSDILARMGHGQLVAVLPETSKDEAALLVGRMVRLLPGGVAERLRTGIAAFPDEELTWVGLKSLSAARAAPRDSEPSETEHVNAPADLTDALAQTIVAAATSDPKALAGAAE